MRIRLRNWITSPKRRSTAGSAAFGGLLWLIAIVLFCAPFLRTRDNIGSEAGDWARDKDKDIPFAEDVANYEAAHGTGLAAAIAKASDEYFGQRNPLEVAKTGAKYPLRADGVIDIARLVNGQEEYVLHCIGCHGVNGDGGGPAARYLNPRPRNFRKGLFKFTSTEAGARPQRRDLFQTITRGLAGSAMPEFRLLSEEKRLDLVEYVRWLGLRGEFEQAMLDDAYENEELPDAAEYAQIVNKRWNPENLRSIYPGALETDRNAASVEHGRALFNDSSKGSCFSCHGAGGRGDGPTAGDYKDDWGYPLRPRDLTLGMFRAGAEGADLYRTISAGIKGSPMGSFSGALAPQEIWDLVHFVQSLSKKGS